MQIYQFTKEESSAIQRLALDDALSIATVTFQRAKGEGKAYAYECSDIGAFQALRVHAPAEGIRGEVGESGYAGWDSSGESSS